VIALVSDGSSWRFFKNEYLKNKAFFEK